MNLKEKILSGIMGLCVGDALGVPVEFQSRESLKKNPVVDMREFGTHNQPRGTWSDDTSMALCSIVSLTEKGLDIQDIRKRFEDWYYKAYMTPHGKVFDCGITVAYAIENRCGCNDTYDNGNGSLMRILPVAYYIYAKNIKSSVEIYSIVKKISSITHSHNRSVLACAIYVMIAISIIEGNTLKDSLTYTINIFKDYPEFYYFQDLYNIESLKENEIDSGGYVVSTLKSSIWCLLNSSNYQESVLKAVNLGSDTDTTGAVCGGLAGLIYGYDSIPKFWLDTLIKRDYLETICIEYSNSLEKGAIPWLTKVLKNES